MTFQKHNRTDRPSKDSFYIASGSIEPSPYSIRVAALHKLLEAWHWVQSLRFGVSLIATMADGTVLVIALQNEGNIPFLINYRKHYMVK